MTSMDGVSTPGGDWQHGMNLLTAGNTSEAIQSLQQFVHNRPDSFEGHNYLGVALAQSKRFDEAIASLQKATQLNAQSAQVRFNLGLALEGANRREAARKEYQSAVQLDPSYAAATQAISRLDAAASTPWAGGEAATQQMGAQQIAEREQQAKPHVLNVLGGLAAGFVAAILCAIVWDKLTYYTHFQIGYVAVGIGFVVGSAVVLGAGGKHGRSLQVLGALLSLLGIVLGETLLATDHVRDYIAANPSANTANASSIDVFFFRFALLPEILRESPMRALFAILGLWCGWTTPGLPKEEVFPEATATDVAPAPAVVALASIDAPLSTPTANTVIDAPSRN